MFVIKSDAEKKTTLELINNFKKAIEEVNNSNADDLIKQSQINGYKIQTADLEKQIEEYDELKKGNLRLPENLSFSELLGYLTKVRISKGISQSELAKMIGVSRQQISRYELQDYRGASLERINLILNVLGLTISIKLQDVA
ncbi:MAG: helix-turn-helix transcriptional regulator [bacterium]